MQTCRIHGKCRYRQAAGIWLVLGVWVAAPLARADRYAAQNGQTPSGSFVDWTSAASNIQDAVNAAGTNDTVWIGSGTYTLPTNAVVHFGTNVVYIDKPLTLRSSNGVPGDVLLDGGGNYRGIAVTSSADSAYTLSIQGLVFTNCYGHRRGGGLYIAPNGTFTSIVQDCLFVHNTAGMAIGQGDGGGGLEIYHSGIHTISNCTFRRNVVRVTTNAEASGGGALLRVPVYTANAFKGRIDNCLFESNSILPSGLTPLEMGAGGGLSLQIAGGGYYEIRHSIFRHNAQAPSAINASMGGGAIQIMYTANARMWNCLVAHNRALGTGGGIYLMKSGNAYDGLKLFNCTIVSNYTSESTAGGIARREAADRMELCNTIVASNRSASIYVAYQDVVTSSGSSFTNCCVPSGNIGFTNIVEVGAGNITNSPAFADFNGLDFRLTDASPCLNAGTNLDWMENAVDLDGKARVDRVWGTADMGCYEMLPAGTLLRLR